MGLKMRAVIFTDSSGTTASDGSGSQLRDYFQGGFRVIRALNEEISDHFDTEFWIVTDDLNILNSERKVSEVAEVLETDRNSGFPVEESRNKLLDQVDGADLVVFALQTTSFEKIVGAVWGDVVEAAKPGSIWCLGVAKSVLDNLEFEEFEGKGCKVLSYERVGVARLDKETRTELLSIAGEQRDAGVEGGQL